MSHEVSRRSFLASAAATAGLALSTPRQATHASTTVAVSNKPVSGTDVVTLGKSGIKSTILGLGTGTRGGSEQRRIGPDAFVKLVRHAYDRGIRYIDTADNYKTHGIVRLALQSLPREEFFIQTKTPAKDAALAKADIERFRVELGTDYLDTLLMHCMTKRGFDTDMRPIMDVLHEAKEKGRVRAVGVSCHGLAPLQTSATCDWCDVHLVRINPFGQKMDGKPEEVAQQIRTMHDRGHGVIGMKIFGETGLESREQRLESLKYVLGLGTVDAFTIGFQTPEQIDETLDLIQEATA